MIKRLLWCLVLACAFGARADTFTFSTVAGLAGAPGAVDGTNTYAKLKGPSGVSRDTNGNLYLSDGSAIRQIVPGGGTWVIRTLAGVAGNHGYVDGLNTNALFDLPQGLCVDAASNIYVADTLNNAIRKLTPSGSDWVATTLAGAGRLDPGTEDGTNTDAHFDHPYGVVLDAAGNLFVADTYNDTIRKLTRQGANWVVTTIAGRTNTPGTTDGTNGNARFNSPAAITIDGPSGTLYVADFVNNTIRAITPSGTNWVVSTIAGLAGVSGSADGTNANARFNAPAGVAVDGSGNLYVTDSGNNTVRILKRLGANWVVTTLAGSPGLTGTANGTGSAARFNQPTGICVDQSGRAFVADNANYTVRSGRLAILLQASVAAGQLRLSWPTGAVGFFLESAPASGGSWQQISSGIVQSWDTYAYSTNSTAPISLFRLHKP